MEDIFKLLDALEDANALWGITEKAIAEGVLPEFEDHEHAFKLGVMAVYALMKKKEDSTTISLN